ncbi:MAG: 2-C-methyl-D-erythritol 4-phosphate cytidylyltransferase [Candidatus Cloacimonas sp. 4484_140]|nr:MAG: 2-C-methyl-D-erythritol 4-phosphate cytidylyltransferase [Candidatus Cloacimonas sp. 4484_140]
MNNYAIITAAGSGQRMNFSKKKQFIEIEGKPILLHTLDKFIKAQCFDSIIITCPVSDVGFLEDLLFSKFNYERNRISIIPGGKRRQDSVYNALKIIGETTEIVAIHDSVRPFVKVSEIVESIELAKKYGAVTLAHHVKNTIKQVENNQVIKTLDRKNLWEIHTPQTFRVKLIKKAHDFAKSKNLSVRDDAELVEILGHTVHVIKGSPYNIKITDPFDLIFAKLLFKKAL